MNLIAELEKPHFKAAVADVRPGDSVRVHHLIKEGNKQRIQVFEGVVIRSRRAKSLTADITVRRIASGIGVEKTFLLHSPNVTKVDVIKRSKVRRNFLSYLRARRGKSARLQEVEFDREAANVAPAVASTKEEIVEVAETEVVENTEEIAKEESVEAEESAVATESSDDEQEAAQQEAEQGLERAAQEDSAQGA